MAGKKLSLQRSKWGREASLGSEIQGSILLSVHRPFRDWILPGKMRIEEHPAQTS